VTGLIVVVAVLDSSELGIQRSQATAADATILRTFYLQEMNARS